MTQAQNRTRSLKRRPFRIPFTKTCRMSSGIKYLSHIFYRMGLNKDKIRTVRFFFSEEKYVILTTSV